MIYVIIKSSPNPAEELFRVDPMNRHLEINVPKSDSKLEFACAVVQLMLMAHCRKIGHVSRLTGDTVSYVANICPDLTYHWDVLNDTLIDLCGHLGVSKPDVRDKLCLSRSKPSK